MIPVVVPSPSAVTMPNTPYKCLVTIVRANVADPRVVTCLGREKRRLFIPVGDYAIPEAEGRMEMVLNAPDSWFAEVVGGHMGQDLVCRYVINLDKFDELPWAVG